MGIDRTRLKLRAFNRKRARFGEDVCSLNAPTLVDGGSAGDSITHAAVVTDIPCFVEMLGQSVQTVVGGETFVSSHRIQMERTAITEVITPEYRVKVAARDTTPERVFENPVMDVGSWSPLITVNASLVRQGYQR